MAQWETVKIIFYNDFMDKMDFILNLLKSIKSNSANLVSKNLSKSTNGAIKNLNNLIWATIRDKLSMRSIPFY